MSAPTSSQVATSRWEEMRRQARQLENDIDAKLIAYSRLGSSYSPGSSVWDESVDRASRDLEQLLNRLTELNGGLSECVQTVPGPGAAYLHTLQRHRDILHDYSQEFRKTRGHLIGLKEREDLLGSVHRDAAVYKSAPLGSGPDGEISRSESLLLTEREHLLSADHLVDDQLSVAAGIRSSLSGQGAVLRGIRTRVNALTMKFPRVNALVKRINFRQRRDAIILACVIGLCLIGLIFFVFR